MDKWVIKVSEMSKKSLFREHGIHYVIHEAQSSQSFAIDSESHFILDEITDLRDSMDTCEVAGHSLEL